MTPKMIPPFLLYFTNGTVYGLVFFWITALYYEKESGREREREGESSRERARGVGREGEG